MRMKTTTTVVFIVLLIIWVLLTINTPFPSPEAARVGPLWELQSEQLLLLELLGTTTTFFSFILIRQLYGKIESLEKKEVSPIPRPPQ